MARFKRAYPGPPRIRQTHANLPPSGPGGGTPQIALPVITGTKRARARAWVGHTQVAGGIHGPSPQVIVVTLGFPQPELPIVVAHRPKRTRARLGPSSATAAGVASHAITPGSPLGTRLGLQRCWITRSRVLSRARTGPGNTAGGIAVQEAVMPVTGPTNLLFPTFASLNQVTFDGSAPLAGTVLDLQNYPFAPARILAQTMQMVYFCDQSFQGSGGPSTATVISLQSSPDGVTWTDMVLTPLEFIAASWQSLTLTYFNDNSNLSGLRYWRAVLSGNGFTDTFTAILFPK